MICIVQQADLLWCTSQHCVFRKKGGHTDEVGRLHIFFAHLHSYSSHHAASSLLCTGEFDLSLHALFISYLLTPKGVVILQTWSKFEWKFMLRWKLWLHLHTTYGNVFLHVHFYDHKWFLFSQLKSKYHLILSQRCYR